MMQSAAVCCVFRFVWSIHAMASGGDDCSNCDCLHCLCHNCVASCARLLCRA